MNAPSSCNSAPLQVLHRDNCLLAVCKPAGLLVHRSALDRHAEDDLLSRLLRETGERLWPVHRLDKGTSGVLLLARQRDAAAHLGTQFTSGAVGKRYLVLVRGWPHGQGSLDHPLARDPEQPSAGQPRLPARTDWRVLQRLSLPLRTHPDFDHTRLALLMVEPHQGRRHQIRRHFKHLGHPLIGDATHGKGPLNRAIAAHLGLTRLWLHALELKCLHPETGAPLLVQAPPGPEWARWTAGAAQA